MRIFKTRRYGLKVLLLIPILVALPAAWWQHQIRYFQIESAVMDQLPEGTTLGFAGNGKWLNLPRAMKRIAYVDLSNARLSDTILGDLMPRLKTLQKLDSLNLSNAKVSEDSVRELQQLPQLRRIELRNVRLSRSTLADLARKLPNTVIVTDPGL